MKYAVVKGNFVENVIVANPEQKAELEAALDAALMDAAALDMQAGDFYNGAAWTRNVNGEQVPLPVGDNPAVAAALKILEGETHVDQ